MTRDPHYDQDAVAAGLPAALPFPDTLTVARAEASLVGRRVLVVGLGESGLAMARWAAFKGAVVTVADTRAAPPKLNELRATCPHAALVTGELPESLLESIDLVGWSQGLSPHRGPAVSFYAAAQTRSIPVWGDLEFFAREHACWRAAGVAVRVVAISGTNGKTTTTRLVAHLCRQAGRTTVVAGNIGPAVLTELLRVAECDEWPGVWVLEVASYQLALSQHFAPDVATILNVTQDHLDWHHSMADYLAAKQRIYAAGTLCVENRDDPLTQPNAVWSDGTGTAPTLPASAASAASRGRPPAAQRAKTRAARPEPARVRVSFGLDAPVVAPGFGVVHEGGLDWLAEAVLDDDALSARRHRGPASIRVKPLMPVAALPIRGAHNQANVLAALALARSVDVPMAAMLHALRSFQGEPHRCELIALFRDVEWYDDSKGTNVGATVAALSGLGRPVVLIAGGDGKGQDFAPLAPAVAQHARAVVLIGRDAPAIRLALSATGVPLEDCATLEAAVVRAAEMAEPGSAVLLSPACASWDMFRDYAHRAEVFVTSVRRLAEDAGQPC